MKKTLLILILLCFVSLALAGDVTVSWDANTEADLAGYKVYYGTGSGNYQNIVDVANVTSHQITELAEGFTYFFAVTAYDSTGNESEYSQEVNIFIPIITPPDITAPFAPTNVTVEIKVQ